MATTLGIVEIPKSSVASASRHQANPLARRLIGGKPLLEWVVRRVTESLLLDGVVVLFDPRQASSLEHLAPADVSVFVSPQKDALSRFAAACRAYSATEVVRVSLDCPLIDPALIDRLICTANAHPDVDYIAYGDRDGRPSVQSRLGMFAEWCRCQAIYRADRRARSAIERAEVTRYLHSHAEAFRLRLIPAPAQLDRSDLRLTVTAAEDWENVQTIVEALGPDQLDWQAIVGLLNQQPALRQRMADLNLAEQVAETSVGTL